MSGQADLKTTLEIGHILSLEIVDYSSLSIDDQTQRLSDCRKQFSITKRSVWPDTRGELIQLSKEDGMALVFFRTPRHRCDAPLRKQNACSHRESSSFAWEFTDIG
jgi:hypothetical protein